MKRQVNKADPIKKLLPMNRRVEPESRLTGSPGLLSYSRADKNSVDGTVAQAVEELPNEIA